MNHNYVNWEITQLLPDNPHFIWGQSLVWINEKELDVHLSYSNLSGEMVENDYLREGWTWEDLRIFLEIKGFWISYEHNPYDEDVSWYVCVNNNDNRIHSTKLELEKSYEIAREKAIKYCLGLLNAKITLKNG